MKQQLSNMEFGRRMATERDLEKDQAYNRINISKNYISIKQDRHLSK